MIILSFNNYWEATRGLIPYLTYTEEEYIKTVRYIANILSLANYEKYIERLEPRGYIGDTESGSVYIRFNYDAFMSGDSQKTIINFLNQQGLIEIAGGWKLCE